MSDLRDNSMHNGGFTGFGLLQVEGRDRTTFLQGQLTQDITQLRPDGHCLRAAALNPPGRVLATAWAFASESAISLLLADSQAAFLAEHLKRYVLRSQVQLNLNPENWQADCLRRLTGSLEPAHWPIKTLEDLYSLMVQHGFAEVTRDTQAQFTAQQLNLDVCEAISFSKGCYTGQEIVVRTAHRGQVKRRLKRLRASSRVEDLKALSTLSASVVAGSADLAADSNAVVVNVAQRERETQLLVVTPLDSGDEFHWHGIQFSAY